MSREKQIEEMASVLCTQYNNGKCIVYGKCEDNCSFREAYKRLYSAGYRKQSENTIELPCKVGDTVWWADTDYEELLTGEVVSFSVQKEGLWAYCRYKGGLTYWHLVSDYFGKTVFLTKEEAEEKMKGGE